MISVGYCCGLDNGKSAVAWIDVTNDQAAKLKTIDEPRDHAFISSESDGELSGCDYSGFNAAKKNTGFLDGHPKSQEAAVK